MLSAGMTSAAALGQIAIALLVGVPLVFLAAMWAAFRWPGHDSRVVYESGSLGAPGHFREPAEPSYVDALLRVRGRFPAIPPVFRADPYAELAEPESLDDIPHPPVSPARPYSVPLAQLVASVRYVKPAPRPAVHTHRAQTVDTADRERATVGRHRALPELVAA